jgi:hypothetical protein
MSQIDLDFSRAARDRGMAQALDHAEREEPTWGDLAFAFLKRYAARHATFISEDVSDASREWGMIQPPTDRAWGPIYCRAAKAGIIVRDGTGVSRRRHASICPRWRSTALVPTAAPASSEQQPQWKGD